MVRIFAFVLIVDTNKDMFEQSVKEWGKRGITANRVDNMVEAVYELSKKQYYLVVIVETIDIRQDVLEKLQLIMSITTAPVIIASHDYIDSEYRIKVHKHGVVDLWNVPETVQESVEKGCAMIRQYTARIKNDFTPAIMMSGDVIMFIDYHTVLVKGIEVELHKIEFNILKLLMSYPRRVFTHEQIIKEVWGDEYIDNSKNCLWVQIKRLKEKLQVDEDATQYIQTKRGVGYSFIS